MVFFECPNGAAAFSIASIAYLGSLGHNDHNNNVAWITTNVLRRLADSTPFEPLTRVRTTTRAGTGLVERDPYIARQASSGSQTAERLFGSGRRAKPPVVAPR